MRASEEEPSIEHELARALGESRERVSRLERQVAEMETLLLQAERAQQLVATHRRRVEESQTELAAARATIDELSRRVASLERKQPWWRRLREKRRRSAKQRG
jgi:polyhydroxyalkanoate synthesis regulator phasin